MTWFRCRYSVPKFKKTMEVLNQYPLSGPLAEQLAAQDAAERLQRQAPARICFPGVRGYRNRMCAKKKPAMMSAFRLTGNDQGSGIAAGLMSCPNVAWRDIRRCLSCAARQTTHFKN